MSNFSQKSQVIIESFQKDRGELPVQQSEELVEFKSLMKDYIRYKIVNEQVARPFQSTNSTTRNPEKEEMLRKRKEALAELERKAKEDPFSDAAKQWEAISGPAKIERMDDEDLRSIDAPFKVSNQGDISFNPRALKEIIPTVLGLGAATKLGKTAARTGAKGVLQSNVKDVAKDVVTGGRHITPNVGPHIRAAAGTAKDVVTKKAGDVARTAGDVARATSESIPKNPIEYLKQPVKYLNPRTINRMTKQLPGPLKLPFVHPIKTIGGAAIAGETLPFLGKGMEGEFEDNPTMDAIGAGFRALGKPAIQRALEGDIGGAAERATSYTVPSSWGIYGRLALGIGGSDLMNKTAEYFQKGVEKGYQESTGRELKNLPTHVEREAVRRLPGGEEVVTPESEPKSPWSDIYPDFEKDFKEDFGRTPSQEDWDKYWKKVGR